MKIISISDIHGDFETLDKVLDYVSKSDAELLTINGDLSGKVFNGEERESFIKSSEVLRNLAPQVIGETNGNIKTFYDLAKFVSSGNVQAPDELKKIAESYLKFEEKARKNMEANYLEFRARFKQLGKRIILVPGNWDLEFMDDYLAQYNLHGKYPEEFNGIKFVGYGGSNKHPVELPIDLITKYDSDDLYMHLCKYEDAEVVLTHTIPRGFEMGSKYAGEYSLLAYLYRNSPSLILTGDTHIPFVAKEPKTGTIVANPGNLGRYEKDNFGTFLELEINEDMFVKPLCLHRLDGETTNLKEKNPQ